MESPGDKKSLQLPPKNPTPFFVKGRSGEIGMGLGEGEGEPPALGVALGVRVREAVGDTVAQAVGHLERSATAPAQLYCGEPW